MQHSELVPAREIYRACGISRTHADQERREAWAEQCELSVIEMAHLMDHLRTTGMVIATRLHQAQAVFFWATEILGEIAQLGRLSDGRYVVRIVWPEVGTERPES